MMSFPKNLYDMVEEKAQMTGMLFPEYIRNLMLNDVKNRVDYVEYVDDPELVKELQQVDEEINSGDYVAFDPSNEKELREALPISSK